MYSPSTSHLALGITLLASGSAYAQTLNQVSFSIDWQGPTIAASDSTYSFPISEGDVLAPQPGVPAFGPLTAPGIALSSGFIPTSGLGLAGQIPCFAHGPGTPCVIEVDALSYGTEPLTGPGSPMWNSLYFSVDRQARGLPSAGGTWNVTNQAPWGDAAADVFVDLGLGVGPLPPFSVINFGNQGVVDGDGLISGGGALYKGVGIVEPCNAGSTLPNPGDNLDALARLTMLPPASFPAGGVYFSLDAWFVDPMTGIWNSGSAAWHSFQAGDVLHTATPSGAPVVFAPELLLGLGLTSSPDDLDALILHENGTNVFEPSQSPNDWMSGATDMLLFSVRRGSGVIGMPDSIFGLPICPGDILTVPVPASAGGVSPFPGIYVAAENLGLITIRAIPGVVSDDLDALDIGPPINDCNGNGVEDAIDIMNGTSNDLNNNGVPDECELLVTSYCHCDTTAPAPCSNFYAPGGCVNSTGVGAILTASGTTSVTADNLVLTTTQMPINKMGIMFLGPNAISPVPFNDGIRCIGGPIYRTFPINNSGPFGTWTYGPGLSAWTIGNLPPPGWILPSVTMNFQSWFRDPLGPCGTAANTSNAIQALFTL